MSFSVHQVTQRAGGGEIARTRTLQTLSPLIGRGADCDIHLPDLAVDLRHARLFERTDGRVAIEALGELGFEVDGRFVRYAMLDPAEGAEVVIGGYRLVFSRGDGGEVRVSVGRTVAAADTASNTGETAIFAPPSAVFGRRTLAWTFGLAILLLCLAIPTALFFFAGDHRTIQADQQWTSGPLSKSHAFLKNDCQACHKQAFVAVRDDACLSCHGASGSGAALAMAPKRTRADGGPAPILVNAHAPLARLRVGAPLPADLPRRLTAWLDKAVNHPNDRCASCHVEHIPAPAVGSVASTAPRNLPLLKTVNDCVDCHRSLSRRLPDTALSDTPDWARHPEFRPYIAVAGIGGKLMVRRTSLTPSASNVTGLIFSHRIHLLPAGGVARMAQELGRARGYGSALDCGACHRPDAAGRGFIRVSMEQDCRACHTMAFARDAGGVRVLPHGSVQKLIVFVQSFYGGGARPTQMATNEGRRRPDETPAVRTTPRYGASELASGLLRASVLPGGACAFCHRLAPPPVGSLAFVVDPVPQLTRHLPGGAFDHGVTAHHQDASGRPTCGACHVASLADSAGALLLPSITRCAACHGNRAATTPAAANCTECHDYHQPGRAKLTAQDRAEIAAWRPSLIKVSQTIIVATGR